MRQADLSFDQVVVGAALPTYTIPLSLQRLVMEAGVNRDFAPQHLDRDWARSSGAPDVFANTTFIQSVFEATIRQWLGSAGRLRKLRFTMLGFNQAGSQLTCGGTVAGKRVEDGRGLVDVEVWQQCQDRRTVTGTVLVELPPG